ncbi:MAG: hypothetical protein NVS4B3_20240 [Gemmatimonadaceae bacterium]
MAPPRIFLLSPARCDGERAKLLLSRDAAFPVATALREPRGVELGALFSFLSALYFRGKLAYARAFARAPRRMPGVLVITTDRGLVPPETLVGPADVAAFAAVNLAAGDDRYLTPLRHDVASLAGVLPRSATVVLLGSIATGKYVDTLLAGFGQQLLFPVDFVGRGDMSRGSLLLRHTRSGQELPYGPLAGADRRGSRPPKLKRVG